MANVYNLKKGVSETTDLKDVTATAAELNILDGVTATAAELNTLDNVLTSVSYTIGTEATNAITVNIQFLDAAGVAMATRASCRFFLSDDANGDSLAATAPDGGVAAGTDGFIEAITANKSFFGFSEADGDLDVVITETGADTWYLIAVMPNDSYVVSAAITFA
jgi:hypothetical protein